MRKTTEFLQTLLLATSVYVCLSTIRDRAAPWAFVALYWALLTVKNLMGGK